MGDLTSAKKMCKKAILRMLDCINLFMYLSKISKFHSPCDSPFLSCLAYPTSASLSIRCELIMKMALHVVYL